jgi:hypothetical protein
VSGVIEVSLVRDQSEHCPPLSESAGTYEHDRGTSRAALQRLANNRAIGCSRNSHSIGAVGVLLPDLDIGDFHGGDNMLH